MTELFDMIQGVYLSAWQRQMESLSVNKIPESMLVNLVAEYGLEYKIDLVQDRLTLTHPEIDWLFLRCEMWRIDDVWWYEIHSRGLQRDELDVLRSLISCAIAIAETLD